MTQYRERRNARSTAVAWLGNGARAPICRVIVLLAAVATVPSCSKPDPPTEPAPVAPLPETVLLAEHAPPFYSLQESAAGGEWIAVFANAADLTLRLARGPLSAPRAHADELVTIDRVDLVPGINPYFGRHAYLQHDGTEHLFYTDQELADSRVTKWIYRSVEGDDPWTVDLLPRPAVPVAVLPGSAPESEDSGFKLFGLLVEHAEQSVLSYEVRPDLLEEQSAPIHADGRSLPANAAPPPTPGATGPAVSSFHCAGRHGFSMTDHAGLLVVEHGREDVRIELPGREPELPSLPYSVACGSEELLVVAYARDDDTAGQSRDSHDTATPGVHEIVALAVDASGAPGPELRITLAREVRALAVLPERWEAGTTPAAPPGLMVLFSELAPDDSGDPEYRLSLILPDADGTYRKLILARGGEPVQDARVLRAGGKLAVLFRRANQLRMLLADAPQRADRGSQSAGGW